jgi:hypothetical protein
MNADREKPPRRFSYLRKSAKSAAIFLFCLSPYYYPPESCRLATNLPCGTNPKILRFHRFLRVVLLDAAMILVLAAARKNGCGVSRSRFA